MLVIDESILYIELYKCHVAILLYAGFLGTTAEVTALMFNLCTGLYAHQI